MRIQVRFLRSIRNLIAVAIAVALLSVVAATTAFAAEAKAFTAVKTCSGLLPTTPITQTCVINPSTLKILRGGTSHYINIVFYNSEGVPVPRSSATYLSSPMLFTAIDKRLSTAVGRCTFFIAGPSAKTGHCEWWSGTGRLAGFNSRWAIGTVGPHVFSIAGTYRFDRDGDRDEDNNDD
jgi:hypothetical protein